MDLAFPVSLVGRYLEYWNQWSEQELRHILGYIAHSVGYKLHFINKGDMWEDLWLEAFADASVGAPRSDGGRLLLATGRYGSSYPLTWRSRRQATAATSSGDAECIEWSGTAKDALRV